MPEIQYPTNPNSDTAFVVQEGGTKNRALMTAPQDTSTLELPNNPNSTKGYVTVDGKKHRVILTAVLAGGGDKHNLGYYATQAALEEAHPTAEAGDWAIVGATDTVWIWDTDNSAWKDSDQKGQVTSVNGQTGAVTLSIPDAIQYSTMPTASADNLGDIVQFTGTTDANYTNGYFYQCVSDGQEPATYSWTQTNVQPAPSGLPDQTGQNGKFLTTDGTDASWSDKPLVNKATGNESLSVGNVGTAWTQSVNVGINSTVVGANCVAVGCLAKVNNAKGVAIGFSSSAYGASTIAIGYSAQAVSQGSIQISTYNGLTQNNDANTFKVANQNGNFEIMSADGTIPTARFATDPVADGTYVPTVVVSSGVATRSWAAPSGGGVSSISVTLPAADWSGSAQTVTATGVTASNTVIIGATPASQAEYTTCGVICTSQGADSLTFTCTSTPTNDLTVTVLILA